MNHFINFDVNTGLSINTYRQPNALYNFEIDGLIEDMAQFRNSCCPLTTDCLHLFEDGHAWAGTNATSEMIEDLHSLITNFFNGDIEQ